MISVTPGYAGGNVPNPSYYQVVEGDTGHAEVVRVVFDPYTIKLQDLLNVFFTIHDPTTRNRQGHDVGTQYRSIILYTEEEQYTVIQQFMDTLTEERVFSAPLLTEVKQLEVFYEAEKEHVRYYERNSDQMYCQLVINPKLTHLKEKYAHLMR